MSTANRSPTRGASASPTDTDPGEVLRGIRTERGMTLAEVSKRTGMPISTLSKVETGKISLSYEKLMRLSRGLDIDITRLFAASKPASAGKSLATGRRTITRAGDGPRIRTATYDYVYPSADLLNKSLNPMIIDVQVRSIAEFGDMMRHPGEEYALVLEGQCEFHCDLYAPSLMSTGDSVYFDGSMGHAYVAVGDGPCRILSICSATDADLKSVLNPLRKDPE
ncbi:helix-turn-helix domain-containing protein [Sphingosinicella soli]|uniref:Transcriptional regulator with XRE-family HTH domain n=1 Tax=Sphingosinicella soli TaxID=333708 RepID=A0A7W7B106_9SPHN|nr:XRE family transcriptional regulator [Sphingosinicella soli]MBB4631038.1 transcriptional regulator with XRE-family HTH domain [Sphingosinicella soli]